MVSCQWHQLWDPCCSDGNLLSQRLPSARQELPPVSFCCSHICRQVVMPALISGLSKLVQLYLYLCSELPVHCESHCKLTLELGLCQLHVPFTGWQDTFVSAHATSLPSWLSAGCDTWYVQPQCDPDLGIAHGVAPEALQQSIEAACQAGKPLKAVLVVSPTYFGVCSDIPGADSTAGKGHKLLFSRSCWHMAAQWVRMMYAVR